MRHLPPVAELIAFEAVARRLSFTLAAQELCLTQSAVSHRVRRLERHLGRRLFHRMNPGVALTEAGAALLPELTSCLDRLASLGAGPRRRLRIAAGSALCSWWLAGRLLGFMAGRPDLSIDLVPIETGETAGPDIDVRVLWVGSGEDEQTPTQSPLFAEWVFPVCAPGLLPGGRPLRDAGALARMTLLHKGTDSQGEWSWPLWLDRLGVVAPAGPSLRLGEMGLVLSAAVQSAGVALARSLLVHDALADGRLVPAVHGAKPIRSSKRHVARWAAPRVDDPDIGAFVGWLAREAASTVEPSPGIRRAA